MENSHRLKIETQEFEIDFPKYLDYCCAHIKPKQRMNRDEHRKIKTDKTDGVYSISDLFQMSACSIRPLAEYLKDTEGVVLLQDIGDIVPEEDLDGVLIAFNNQDGFSFEGRQELFAGAFASWVAYEYGNEEYKRQIDEYEKDVNDACDKLNVSHDELESALQELHNGLPEERLSETAKRLKAM